MRVLILDGQGNPVIATVKTASVEEKFVDRQLVISLVFELDSKDYRHIYGKGVSSIDPAVLRTAANGTIRALYCFGEIDLTAEMIERVEKKEGRLYINKGTEKLFEFSLKEITL